MDKYYNVMSFVFDVYNVSHVQLHNLPGILDPPLNRTTSPFMYGHSTIHRTVWANSGASPNRCGKVSSRIRRAFISSDNLAVMADVNKLGAMALTRMPYRAKSRASGRVRLLMAPLDAAYAVCPYWPSNCDGGMG